MSRVEIARADSGRPDALERAVDRSSRKKAIEIAVAAERERCAELVPTNWCDSLLTGKDAPKLPLGGREVEALLRGIQDRIRKGGHG
jgi:hypothetical protein